MASSEQAEQPNQVRGVGLPRRDCQGSRLERRSARGWQWGSDPDSLKPRTPRLRFSSGPRPSPGPPRPAPPPVTPSSHHIPGLGARPGLRPPLAARRPLGARWTRSGRVAGSSWVLGTQMAGPAGGEVGKARWYPAVPCGEGPDDSRSHGLGP